MKNVNLPTVSPIKTMQIECELKDESNLKKHIVDFLTALQKDFNINVSLQLFGEGIQDEVAGIEHLVIKADQAYMMCTRIDVPIKNWITLIPNSRYKTHGLVLAPESIGS